LNSKAKTFSKSALLTAAIACVTAGVKLLDSDVFAAVILIALGLGLIFSYITLLEKQAVEVAVDQALAEKDKG